MSCRVVSITVLGLAVLGASPLQAQVKTVEKTKTEFAGPLGGMMKVFGGGSYRNGTTKTIAVKGDRKMTIDEDTAELVDLKEEKVYQIDMKGKSYKVMTFEEMRKQMQDALDKAKAQRAAQTPAPKEQQPAAQPQEPQFEIDFKLQESGQKKTIAGYNAREVIATVSAHEKGKPADQGAMVVTSSMWLAPKIAELKQIEDFDSRFAQKMILPFAKDIAEQMQMAPAVGQYPGLGAAMGKLEAEKVNMDGTTVSTVVRAGVAGSPDQKAAAQPPAQQQPKQADPAPKTLGGLLGGLGKKAITSNKKEEEPKPASDPGTLMTTTEELVSVSTAVTDADVSIPAGFKEKK
jgi:hypothetical protein